MRVRKNIKLIGHKHVINHYHFKARDLEITNI